MWLIVQTDVDRTHSEGRNLQESKKFGKDSEFVSRVSIWQPQYQGVFREQHSLFWAHSPM